VVASIRPRFPSGPCPAKPDDPASLAFGSLRAFGLLIPILLTACPDPGTEPPPPKNACEDVANPIDRVLCPELVAESYQPILAGSRELCTRLSVDLLGRRPTPEEARACGEMDVALAVKTYQETEAYRLTQRRRWADRFSYSDSSVDALAIKALDQLVDALYRKEIPFADFTVEAVTHPAFVGRHIGYGIPEDVARAAFRTFLGRTATRPESADLAPLWGAWISNGRFLAEDTGRTADAIAIPYGGLPSVDPYACEAGVRKCESTLLGRASVDFDRRGREQVIPVSELTPDDWRALQAPGRLFVSLEIFWEAQVDDVLEHYLGYDLGTLRPKVRDALVQVLRDGNDIVELERIVLTSAAYTQPAAEAADRPIPAKLRDLPFAHGPSKLMTAEAWLHSVGAAIGSDVGDCDFRYPDLDAGFFDPALIDALETLYPRNADGTFDMTFRDTARAMGGCPGHLDFGTFNVSVRARSLGLIAAVAQEQAALDLCLDSAARDLIPAGVGSDRASIESAVRNVLDRLVGEVSPAAVTEATDLAMAGCEGCDSARVARELCTGVAGAVEHVIY
jgi:hypothetical protein